MRRYNRWGGNPKGTPEDQLLCIVQVHDRQTRWPSFSQCRRKRGHGPGGLYCKQHAKILAAGRSVYAPSDGPAEAAGGE